MKHIIRPSNIEGDLFKSLLQSQTSQKVQGLFGIKAEVTRG